MRNDSSQYTVRHSGMIAAGRKGSTTASVVVVTFAVVTSSCPSSRIAPPPRSRSRVGVHQPNVVSVPDIQRLQRRAVAGIEVFPARGGHVIADCGLLIADCPRTQSPI